LYDSSFVRVVGGVEMTKPFCPSDSMSGRRALLTSQLRKRFGELPESVRARVSEASPDELGQWGERLLEVSSLSELFIEE
jgi:hypothetical protein